MKYFLIGFVILFILAWIPLLIRCGWQKRQYKRAKKHAGEEDEWMYEVI